MQKTYCDFCKNELNHVFKAEIKHGQMIKLAGGTEVFSSVEKVSLELCKTCYDQWKLDALRKQQT